MTITPQRRVALGRGACPGDALTAGGPDSASAGARHRVGVRRTGIMPLVVALIALIASLLVVGSSSSARAAAPGDPIRCQGSVVYGIDQAGAHTLWQIDPVTGAKVDIGAFTGVTGSLNGLAIARGGTAAYAIGQYPDAGGRTPVLRYVPGAGSTVVGSVSITDFGPTGVVMGGLDPTTGRYWFGGRTATSGIYEFRAFDTDTATDLGIQFRFAAPGGNGDLAFDGQGRLYVVTSGGGAAGNQLTVFDPPHDLAGAIRTGTVLAAPEPATALFNGIAFSTDGYLYTQSGSGTGDRTIYRTDAATGAVASTAVLTGTSSSDLASCSEPNTLTVQKYIDGRVTPADQFALAITGNGIDEGNTGETSGSSTGLQSGTAHTAGPVVVLPGKTYQIGETATGGGTLDDYDSSYRCLDSATGAVVAAGAGPVGDVTVPAGGAGAASINCIITNTPRTYRVVKTADVATAQPGDRVKYTITVTNTGSTDFTEQRPARFTDDLSDVLDDATYNGDATSGATYSAPELSWAGPVPAGGSVAITYSVTVGPAGGGDLSLDNTVVTPPQGGCVAGTTDPDCTVVVPVSSLSTVKTVESVNGRPANAETEVAGGDVVVYRIVTRNTGQAAGSTTLTDAVPANTVYSGSGEGWSCARGADAGTKCAQRITVAAGSSVTNRYTLTVVDPLPDGTRTVANLVTSSDGTCPGCAPSNPVAPRLITTKQISTVNGRPATARTLVGSGDRVSYLVTVRNNGGSPGSTILSDPVPAQAIYDGTDEGWSCPRGSVAGTSCTQRVSVDAGRSVTLRYTMRIVDPLPSTVTEVANHLTTTIGRCASCDPTNPARQVSYIGHKSSDPVAGSRVRTGQRVGYTIVVENTGNVPTPISLVDDMSGAADDGVFSQDVTITGSDVQPVISGTTLSWSDTVPVGGRIRISYHYTVKPWSQQGDHRLLNVLTTPDKTGTLCGSTSCIVPNPIDPPTTGPTTPPAIGITTPTAPGEGPTPTSTSPPATPIVTGGINSGYGTLDDPPSGGTVRVVLGIALLGLVLAGLVLALRRRSRQH